MSYLSRLKAETGKRSETEPSKGAEAPFDPSAGASSGPFPGLPGELVTGLLKLQSMPVPRITLPPVWPEIVADARRLGTEGRAVQALALGWKPLELFGCSAKPGGDAGQEGLAMWLAGRRVLLLDALSCIADDGAGGRSIFYGRSVRPGGVFLWKLGRGARG
jgi:hypothetical protein